MKEKIYAYLRLIPKGQVVTYGQIASYLGDKRLARAVGNALHKNPDPEKYPCYKVVNAKGQLSVNFAFGGLAGQAQCLEKDGIEVANDKVDLAKYQWKER